MPSSGATRKSARLVARLVGAALALCACTSAMAVAGDLTPRLTVVRPHGSAPAITPPVRLHSVEAGSGPVVVLLHGLGGSTYTWRKVLPELARNHRVIALDLKGFGRSEKPLDEAYSPADQAALLVAFLERRGLTDVTLVGHSIGGTVALLAAIELQRRDPQRIARLALIDSPAYPQPEPTVIGLLKAPFLSSLVFALAPPEWPARMALGHQREAGSVDDTDIAAYAEPYREAGARHALIETARHMEPTDWGALTARIPSVRQPTLLVWCIGDTLVPAATGLRLSRALPDNRLATIEGCVHSPPDEKPTELVAILKPWLGSTRPDAWRAQIAAAGRPKSERAGRARRPAP